MIPGVKNRRYWQEFPRRLVIVAMSETKTCYGRTCKLAGSFNGLTWIKTLNQQSEPWVGGRAKNCLPAGECGLRSMQKQTQLESVDWGGAFLIVVEIDEYVAALLFPGPDA